MYWFNSSAQKNNLDFLTDINGVEYGPHVIIYFLDPGCPIWIILHQLADI